MTKTWYFKKFSVGETNYLFDSRTNAILRLRKDVSDDELQSMVDGKYNNDILDGYSGVKRMKFPVDRKTIIDKVENEMKELLLNVTEECNFGCEYCLYSGKYIFERTHSQNMMDKKTMKKAVDLFFKHNMKNNSVYISFYGGEPLLAYDLITDCVNYAKSNSDKDILFGMTSNGFLLTPEKFPFIVDNDFNLLVSIDGPEEIHDRNRKINKQGTHKTIMENLKGLRKYSPNYYKTIGFLATISDPFELKEVYGFYKNNELVKDNRVMTSFVNPFDNEKVPTVSRPEKEMEKIWMELADDHCKSIVERTNYIPFLQRLFDLDLRMVYERKLEVLPSEVAVKGVCIPANRKSFVTTSGDIHICERVGKAFKIGNVDDGIDKEKIFDLVNDYTKLSQEDCPTCWGVRLCKPCYAYFRKDDRFDLERKEEMCDSLKDGMTRALYIYTKAHEQDPTAIKEYFEKYNQTFIP